MKLTTLLPVACAAGFVLSASAAGIPPEALKGKMKPGLYEYKVDMNMDMSAMPPNMPPGMGKQSHTFEHCVTEDDIHRGEMGKGSQNTPKECDIQDFQMTGNTASYKMACTGAHKMNADTKMTFGGDGYTMDMKMQSNEGGHPMNMSQHIVATYKGACTAGAPAKK